MTDQLFCPFCSSSEISQRLILENDLIKVFPTNIPITNGHTLIIPIRHVGKIEDLTKEERLAIFDAVDMITVALKQAFGAEGFNFAWNEGKLAGQSVPHLHLHVIPRKEGDSGLADFDPRSMLYRTGNREISEEKELLRIRNLIQASL